MLAAVTVTDPNRVVVGYFRPFGGKRTNAAAEAAHRLDQMRARGELAVPQDAVVTFAELDRTAASVDAFVDAAKTARAGKVLVMGESLGPLAVEGLAKDRGVPPESVLLSAGTALFRRRSHATLQTTAPIDAMAAAAGARVSADAGTDYCNLVYFRALAAGLPTVFVHVNSGLFEHLRDTDGAAAGVSAMLGAWFQAADPLVAHRRGVAAMWPPGA